MIQLLRLNNFRGFDQHEISLKDLTIIVGRNNAGKSTIVEALRLLSITTNRYLYLPYREAPSWLDIPRVEYGINPSLRGLEIDTELLFHRYNNPPAIIEAEFSTGELVRIYISNEDRIHACIFNSHGRIIRSKREASELSLPKVSIMPQIGPVQKYEKILNEDYVKSAADSRLASLHFRNQLIFFNETVALFKSTVEATWPGVQVRELIYELGLPGELIHLEIRNDDFVGEMNLMGHGLQMWLQTIWFITRAQGSDTIILDEPDVYMHADIQRRLIRYIKGKFPQIIITTHSIEIISEVEPEEILIVDRKKNRSDFANSLPAVQRLIEEVGGIMNLSITRLWHSKKVLFLEGDDIKFLKQFQNTIFPKSSEPIDTLPKLSIDGWGGWNYAIGSTLILTNSFGQNIIPYCIFDSDYHTPNQIKQRKSEANAKNIQLHIWRKKEIENYLLCPAAIERILNRLNQTSRWPTVDEIKEILLQLAEEQTDNIHDSLANEYLVEDRQRGLTNANRKARERIEHAKNTELGLLSIASGKKLISDFSGWLQDNYGYSISPVAIAKEMNINEIDQEIVSVISAIENGENFDFYD